MIKGGEKLVKKFDIMCPKCEKRTKAIKVFNEEQWKMLIICTECGGAFEEDTRGVFTFKYQFATKRKCL